MRLPYLLEMDGQLAGRFSDAHGGFAKAKIATTGSGAIQRKHLEQVEYDDIVLACGPGMSRAFYDWLASSFAGNIRRANGTITQLDDSSKTVRSMFFYDALLKSLDFPDLDKSKSDPASLIVTITPTRTSFQSQSPAPKLGVYANPVPKPWRVSDFRLTIAGMENASLQVTTIRTLKLSEKIVKRFAGESRNYEIDPGGIEFPELLLELPTQYVEPFATWFQQTAVKGGLPSEKQGALDFLAPGSSTPYFTLPLDGLGISGLSQAKGAKNVPSAPSAISKIRLYCNTMSFSAGSSVIL